MPDRTFDEATDDDAEWVNRRNNLVALMRSAPDQSPALRQFTAALLGIADPTQLRRALAWLEQQGRSTKA